MSPLTKILTTSISAGFISSIVGVVSAFIILRIFFDKLDLIFPGGNNAYSTSEAIVSVICLVFLIASLFACPYQAYQIRQSVFDFTDNLLARILLFAVIAGSQIIFLTAEYFLVFPYTLKKVQEYYEPPSPEEVQGKKKDKISKQINNANIDVSVKNAKIIYDDGTNILAEFTLQIKNVPAAVSDYLIEIRHINSDKNFGAGILNNFNYRAKYITLKAVNENDKWIFYGLPAKEFVSDNSDEVKLQVNFFRSVRGSQEMPQTVNLLLRTMLSENKIVFAQIELFNRPVPIHFDNY